MKKGLLAVFFIICLLITSCGEKKHESKGDDAIETRVEPTKTLEDSEAELVDDLIRQKTTNLNPEKIDELFLELAKSNERLEVAFKELFSFWDEAASGNYVNFEVSDNYDDDEGLCIVILGYQLLDNGEPQEELTKRLETALVMADKYPSSKVLVTGGGTAKNNKAATEAEVMAEWLEKNGVVKERIITENKSLTTVENAIFSVNILQKDYPEIKELVIVTSDYHIELGSLLFTEKILLDNAADLDNGLTVKGNLAYKQNRYLPFSRTSCGSCIRQLYHENKAVMSE